MPDAPNIPLWTPLDTWMVVTGAVCAMSCALLGCFLVLRRASMMGDAISHAVLPGLAIGFLLTGSRESVVMLVGAGVVGILAAFFTQWVHRVGRVEHGAAMGVVFTILFAIGLIVIRQAADHVDLDPGCVLYGSLELIPLDFLSLWGLHVPRALVVLTGVLAANVAFVTLLYKELRITTFDPALATSLGFDARLMHYALMALVAITTVAAFESVGSILVIAMLIIPPAAAHLWTDRLHVMLVLSALLAAVTTLAGHVAAVHAPGWLGFPGVSVSTAGMMAVASGAAFSVAFLFAPRHGVISRGVHQLRLRLRIVRQDVLARVYRLKEANPAARVAKSDLVPTMVIEAPWMYALARMLLRRRGHLTSRRGEWDLTPRGRHAAQQLVRAHRLWETYLDQRAGLDGARLHASAEHLEHVTDARLDRQLAATVDDPTRDPHDSPIPPAE